MEKFGFYAENARVKITNPPRFSQAMAFLPGQVGFKQQDGSYINRWVDVKCWNSRTTSEKPFDQIAKGDVVYVTGRFVVETDEYNGQVTEKWAILADAVTLNSGAPSAAGASAAGRTAPPPASPPTAAMDDVPFRSASIIP